MMADPWLKYQNVPEKGPWRKYQSTSGQHGARAQMQLLQKPVKGSVLPLSTDEFGELKFDPTAGILGSIWSAATLPGDVLAGKTQVHSVTPEGKVTISPEVQQRTMNLAMLATPINPAVRAGDLAIPGAKTSLTKATPTIEKVLVAGVKGFEKARSLPVDFSPNAIRNLATTIESKLNERGLPAELAPTTHSLLKKLADIPDDAVAVTGNNVISIRQALQNVADGAAKTAATERSSAQEYASAVSAIKALDNFIAEPGPQGVISGPAAAFQSTYTKARGNVAAAKRAELLGKKEAVAEWRAAAANSGKNLGNALRQRLTDLLANPDKIRGWSEAEKDALEQIVNGTGGMNAWRTISNRLGGGGGLGSSLLAGLGGAVGYKVGGIPGMAAGSSLPVMAGTVSRKIYNTMVSNAVDRLEQMLLQRSPEFEQAAATVANDPKAIVTLLRSWMLIPDETVEQGVGHR